MTDKVCLNHGLNTIRLKEYKWPRCVDCGHRVTVKGIVPKATRYMAPWKWPIELLDRRKAIRR